MPIDWKSVGIGTAIGGPAGGLVGGLLGKKKQSFDTAVQQGLIEQGGREQRGFIGQFRPETQKLTDAFGQSVDTAQAAAQEANRKASEDFLANYDPLVSKIIQSRKAALKQSAFEAIPETVQAAREAGAAGGGLSRGVVQSQLAGIPVQAAAEYAKGARELETQAQEQQLNARSKVYDNENQMILKNLGIDAATAETILNSGNQALISELTGLIDESRNRIGSLVGLENFKQTGQMAQQQADDAWTQGMLQNVFNLGGAAIGGMAGGPAGAAVGSQAGSLITQVPQSSNREAILQSINQSNALESMNKRRIQPVRRSYTTSPDYYNA